MDTERTYRAYDLKPGKDTIAGVAIADFIRPHIKGGWYIPMADGSRRRIKRTDTLVTVGW